jgi:effector-binding domain-containing protein
VIDAPNIIQTATRLTAVIRLTVPREDIQKVMGPGLAELRAAVAAQGIAAGGPWFTHHLTMDPNTFDFEIGVPVTAKIAPSGRVQAGQLPARTVAQTVYHGPYQGLGAARGEFNAWIATNGHTPDPDLWECYVKGPETSADPADWCTELNRPLA